MTVPFSRPQLPIRLPATFHGNDPTLEEHEYRTKAASAVVTVRANSV